MAKKKKKKQGKAPVPFEDRLQRCWERGDWAAYVTLYMRTPREKAERAPAGMHFGAALYNCMATALFEGRDIPAACMAAETLLKENVPARLRDCARVTLDYRRLRDQGYAPLEPLEGGSMPPAYARLRAEMESLVKEAGGKRKGSLLPLLEKLTKQYAALPSAKNASRYNSCCKTAEELREKTESLPCAPVFFRVARILDLIRDAHAASRPFRRSVDLFLDERAGELLGDWEHPVHFLLWEYLCRSGGKRFGADWEAQARALGGLLTCARSKTLPALVKNQMAAMMLFVSEEPSFFETKFIEFVPVLMELPELWDPLTAYFLDLMDLLTDCDCECCSRNDPTDLLETVGRVIRNGRKLRPEAPIPAILSNHLSRRLDIFPLPSLRELLRMGFPAPDVPPVALIRMACAPWWKASEMERALANRLPISLSPAERRRLADIDFSGIPTVSILENLEGILRREDLQLVAGGMFWEVVFRSREEGESGKKLAAQSWAGMSADVLRKFRDLIPKERLASSFCALCCGTKRFTLSSDPELVKLFFQAIPKPAKMEHFILYLWLLTWPDIPLPFLRRMGKAVYSFCKAEERWLDVYRTVSAIRNKPRREEVARDIVEVWRTTDKAKKKNPTREEWLQRLSRL